MSARDMSGRDRKGAATIHEPLGHVLANGIEVARSGRPHRNAGSLVNDPNHGRRILLDLAHTSTVGGELVILPPREVHLHIALRDEGLLDGGLHGGEDCRLGELDHDQTIPFPLDRRTEFVENDGIEPLTRRPLIYSQLRLPLPRTLSKKKLS